MTAAALPTDDRRPFSVPQLADRWGCSEGLVRKLIRSGDLQCFRPGGRVGRERAGGVSVSRAEVDARHLRLVEEAAETRAGRCQPIAPRFNRSVVMRFGCGIGGDVVSRLRLRFRHCPQVGKRRVSSRASAGAHKTERGQQG